MSSLRDTRLPKLISGELRVPGKVELVEATMSRTFNIAPHSDLHKLLETH